MNAGFAIRAALVAGLLAFSANAESDKAAPADSAAPISPVKEKITVLGAAADDAGEAARRSSLGREELRLLPAETLAEAMARLPGMVVYFDSPFGGTPMVAMRGFFGGGEVDYLGLELDGVPQAATETGVADFAGVRLDQVERIDLLSGPSMRHGGVDPALAGMLRVITRPADGAGRGQAAVSLGSYETAGGAASWSGRAGSWQGFLAADLKKTDGYRAENSEAREAGGQLRFGRPLGSSQSLLFSAFGRWRERGEPGPLSASELERDPLASNPLFDDDRENAGYGSASLRWEGPWAGVPLEAHLAADRRRSRFLRTLLVAEGFGDRAWRRVEAETFSAGGSTPSEITLGSRVGLRLSADYRQEEADTRYLEDSGLPRAADSARRERLVGEAGLAFRPHDDLELDLSLRGDRIDDRSGRHGESGKEAWSPRLALVWAPAAWAARPGIELFGEVGKAFKAPTLDQLYDPRPFFGPEGEFNLSNPDLEPQRSRGWELGARGQAARTTWRVLAYRQIVENEIDFDPATFRYANIGRSRHQGIEASCRLAAGKAGVFDLAYARSEAEAEGDDPTGQLKNIPRDVLRLGWAARLGGFELAVLQSYLGGRFADDQENVPLGDVHRTDLRVSRQMGALRLRADIFNAFGQDELELAYLLPSADFQGETLHGFAPAPRAFRVGVETSW
jgi:outer membrane cobalamin receptor